MPRLIMLKGYPGAGKSTVASALSRACGWPVIDKDDIQDGLDASVPAGDALAYEIMLAVARRQLLQGLSVICDSPLWRWTYERALALAEETGARLMVIECRCSDAALRARIEARRDLPARRTTTWEALQVYRARYDAAAHLIGVPHLLVDTDADLSRVIAQIKVWLRQVDERPPDSSGAHSNRPPI